MPCGKWEAEAWWDKKHKKPKGGLVTQVAFGEAHLLAVRTSLSRACSGRDDRQNREPRDELCRARLASSWEEGTLALTPDDSSRCAGKVGVARYRVASFGR